MTNRFSVGVAVIAGVAVDLRLRLGGTTAPTKSKSCCCPRETSSAATATSAPSFMCCAGASPADGALRPNPNTLHVAVTTMDGVCGRLL